MTSLPHRSLSLLSLLLFVATLSPAGAVAAAELGFWNEGLPLPGLSAGTPPAVEGVPQVDFEFVVGGLDNPVVATHAGDGSARLFLVLQDGVIVIWDGSQILATPFLDIQSKVTCCGEQGLLGLAFNPDYDVNGRFYVNYTDNGGDTVIAEYQVSGGDPNQADPGSEVILKTVNQPFTNHNGGNLQFGPDGMLYSGLGDGGSANDPQNNGQTLTTLLGKMIRLDVDSPPDYIPADNPFVGDPQAADEIWAYGLRNPWRWSFDRLTGDLFIGDVGQDSIEEVSFQPASSSGGENYGWRVLEGSSCFIDQPPGSCDDFLNGGSVLPFIEYGHAGGNCSVTGGYRYRGAQFPALEGIYFHADFCSGRIWASEETSPDVWNTQEVLDTFFAISSFGEDEDGELYFLDLGANGELYQLVGVGGSIPCEDIDRFQARCVMIPSGSNRIQTRVILTDASHDGEEVTFAVDGSPSTVTVNGSRATFVTGGPTGGHTVSLQDPPGCFADIAVVCP